MPAMISEVRVWSPGLSALDDTGESEDKAFSRLPV
tara:strand:- start:53862 stop:53966 length:105 start_codon:yes stop_codon:yes gene_type:complete